MTQKPAKRHVLADIRLKCELTQSELAKILGCAHVTVQKIEQGAIGLSEDLAQKIEEELDISASYLLANDPELRPVTARGGLWTKDLYEFAQGAREVVAEVQPDGGKSFRLRMGPHPFEGAMDEFTAWKLAVWNSEIHAMLEGAKGSPRQGILIHRLNKALKSLLEDFKPDEATLKAYEPELNRLHGAYDKVTDRIAEEEQHRIWEEERRNPSKI